MTESVREQTQAVNSHIVEDYYEEGLSITALAQKYGRSESTINKNLARYRREYTAVNGHDRPRKRLPKDPRPQGGKKALSFVHAMIGLAVSRFCTEHKLGPTAFGMLGELGNLSRVKVKEIQAGTYDLKLTEIYKLAKVLGVSPEALLNPTPQSVKEGAYA